MRLPTPRQLLVCLALTGAFGHAGAAELRHMAPESAPSPDTTPSTPGDRMDETAADIDGAVATAHAQQRTQKPKPQATTATTTPHTAGDSRTLPARFHSFLPGMFR